MAERLARAVLELATDAGKYFSDLDKAEKAAKGLDKTFETTSKQFEQYGKAFTKWGTTLSVGVTAPLAAISVAAVAAGQEVDDALDTIRAGTGATGKALGDLEDSFREVFRNVPDSAEDVAEAITELSRRTGQTGPALEQMTTQMLTLARLQKQEVGPLIASTTRLFGDWSIATDKQSGTLDNLYKVSQATGLGVNHLAEQVVTFGAPLRQMGFDLETSAAMLGKWEKEGVNVELVLGSLRIAAAKFASANIPMREGLEATLTKIQELGPGAKATSLAIDVFGRKAGPDMAAAITEGRFAVSDLMKQIQGSKETILGAAKDTDGFAEKWAKLRHQVVLALEPLGVSLMNVLDGLMPLLERGVGWVQKLADWFSNLGPTAQTAVVAIGGIAAAAGPAAFALGAILEKIAALRLAAPALATTMRTLGAAAFGPLGLAALAAGTGIAIATARLQEYTDKVDAALAKQREQIELMAAYRKATGATGDVLLDLTKLTDEQKAQLIAMAKAADTARLSNMGLNVSIEDAKNGMAGKGKATKDAAAAGKEYDAILGELTGSDKEAAKAAKEHAKELKEIESKLRSLGVVTASEVVEALQEFRDLQDDAIKGGVSFRSYLAASIDKLEQLQAKAKASGQSFGILNEAVDRLRLTWTALVNLPPLPVSQSVDNALAALSQAPLQNVKLPTFESIQAVRAVVDQVQMDSALTSYEAFVEDVVQESKDGKARALASWKSFGDELGSVIVAAAAGGGLVSETIGAFLGKKLGESMQKHLGGALKSLLGDKIFGGLSKLLGDQLGGLLNSILPGIGAIAGQFIGKGLSWINDKFFGGEGKKVNDLRDEFKAKFGDAAGAGLQAVVEKWNDPALNAAYDKLMRTGKIEDFQKASKELEKRLGDLEQQAVDTANAIADALGTVGPATNNIVAGFTAKLAPGIKALDELKKKRDELAASGDTSGAAALTNKIQAQAQEAAASNQGEFDRLSRIALAGFNAFIGQGQSAAEAITSLVPAVDALKGSADALGFSGNAAYDQLLRWRDLATNNAPLLEQVAGLNELMSALGTLGALDAATFSDMQAQGVEAFKNLEAAGFSQKEALTQMKPLLENIIQQHEERGMAIDDETQKLIDQAREEGILKAKQLDTNQILMRGLGKLIDMLGGDASDAWQDFGEDAENAAQRAQRSLDGITAPSIEIPVTYRTNGSPDTGYNGDGASAEPEFRWGTPDLDFASFGRARRAVLHGDEAVVPRGSGHELAREIAAAMPQGGGGMVAANIFIDGNRIVRAIVPLIPDEVDRYRANR